MQVSASGSIFSTSGFSPVVGNISGNYLAGQSFTSGLVDITGTSTLSYTIGSLTLASTTAVTFTYPSPAHVVGILKTPTVYYSTENGASTVFVVYSVTDSYGRSQCNPSGVSVSLIVGSASSACSVFASSAAPYGSCSLTVSPSVFSSSSVTLPVSLTLSVASVLVQTSSIGTVTLAAIPSQSTPASVGIYFQMPIYTAVPGDVMTVKMWAQTGGSNTMESWGASLVYDTSKLTYSSVSYPLYTTVLTNTGVTNALNITGSGGTGTISGWFLAATIYFTVTSAAAGTTVPLSMPAILTNAMTNSVPTTYNNNFAGMFADSRGGWAFTTGQLSVLSPTIAGVYAYSTRSSFVNTYTLSGLQSTDTMAVWQTYNTGRAYSAYADVMVQPSSCASANSAVLTPAAASNGCVVTVAQVGGGSSVAVTASLSGFSASVAYRVYYLAAYTLNSTRTVLRRLGCDYETTYLSAFGTVTLDGVTALQTIDLSNAVSFSSSSPSVVSVSGRVAKGLAVGTAVLSYGSGAASLSLSVDGAAATVTQLVSYAYSSVVVTPTAPPALTELSATTVLVQPLLALTAEQQTAAVVTYALDDDGVWTDVSRYSTLTLASNDAVDLSVAKSGSDWQITVPVGASSITGATPVLRGTLTDSCSTTLFNTGSGYVNTNLSLPVAIVITASVPSLARPGTPAATTIGLPTSTQITVTVTFRSALGVLTYRDFSADSRTVFNTSFVSCAGSLSSALLSLSTSSGVGTAGSVTISVTLPSYAAASGLSGLLSIPVVDVNTAVPLQGSLVHSMTTSVVVSAATPLAQLACTGVYQSGLLATVVVTLTDGSTRSGTPVLTSGNTAVAVVSGTTVNALSRGTSVITAAYASATGMFTAWVNSTAVTVTSMTLSYPSSTLSGQTGATLAGSLQVTFNDGTMFTNAISSFSPLSALVGFNSSDPAFVTVSASGLAGLVNNSWRFATLTAYSNCNDGHSSTFSIAGNLAAVNYDTKLGSTTGLTFPPAASSGSVDMSIKVQVSTSPLTTYQVWLFYNSAIFGAPSITKGSGWPVGAFDFTTGNAVSGNIKKAIISFSSGSSATSTLVPMATVTFPVITGAAVLELITANVVALSVASGTIFQSATGTPIVAGTGYVSLNGGMVPQWRRLLALDTEEDLTSRRLLQTLGLPLVTGDCNGDGLFNANDATYAQQLVTNGVGSWPTSNLAQMRNCAPTYSYMFNHIQSSYTAAQVQITIADVAYLLHASTNRVFFLNISSPYDLVFAVPVGTSQPWGATATYYYFPSSTAVSSYSAVPCATASGYFEMNVALPRTYTLSVGSLYGSSSKGVAFQGACSAGTFTVTIVTDSQITLNMSVGFINSATNDAYAFFGMDVGVFINSNTNFVNQAGSTIVSGPIYSVAGSTFAPVTSAPTTAPSTSAPTLETPTSTPIYIPPTSPASPFNPSSPSNPSNPSAPGYVSPTSPASPLNPGSPSNPANPASPGSINNPASPSYVAPSSPASPSNPANPAYVAPSSPSSPSNPANPANPSNPAYVSPTSPASPLNPSSPSSPSNPASPSYLAPSAPANPANPAYPLTPSSPHPTALPTCAAVPAVFPANGIFFTVLFSSSSMASNSNFMNVLQSSLSDSCAHLGKMLNYSEPGGQVMLAAGYLNRVPIPDSNTDLSSYQTRLTAQFPGSLRRLLSNGRVSICVAPFCSAQGDPCTAGPVCPLAASVAPTLVGQTYSPAAAASTGSPTASSTGSPSVPTSASDVPSQNNGQASAGSGGTSGSGSSSIIIAVVIIILLLIICLLLLLFCCCRRQKKNKQPIKVHPGVIVLNPNKEQQASDSITFDLETAGARSTPSVEISADTATEGANSSAPVAVGINSSASLAPSAEQRQPQQVQTASVMLPSAMSSSPIHAMTADVIPSGSHVCIECSKPATFSCADCPGLYCDEHNISEHKGRAASKHVRTPYKAPKPVSTAAISTSTPAIFEAAPAPAPLVRQMTNVESISNDIGIDKSAVSRVNRALPSRPVTAKNRPSTAKGTPEVSRPQTGKSVSSYSSDNETAGPRITQSQVEQSPVQRTQSVTTTTNSLAPIIGTKIATLAPTARVAPVGAAYKVMKCMTHASQDLAPLYTLYI